MNLQEWIQSNEFKTAVAGIVALVLLDVGVNISPEVIDWVAGIVIAALLGQGLVGLGKEGKIAELADRYFQDEAKNPDK